MRWLISFVAGLLTMAIAAVVGVTIAQNTGPVRLGFFDVSLEGSVGELVLAAAALGLVAGMFVLLPELAWSARRGAAARAAAHEAASLFVALQKEHVALQAKHEALQMDYAALQEEQTRMQGEHARLREELREEHARAQAAMEPAVAPHATRHDPTDMGEQGLAYAALRDRLRRRFGEPRDGMRQVFEA